VNERPTRLVLLGIPVEHSLSPRMHGAALRAAGIMLSYDALEISPELLGDTIALARSGGWAGNVTIPHKAAVAAFCDELSATAHAAGAVNCFRMKGSRLHGINTDVGGVRHAIQELLQGRVPRRVLMIGAGGAAAAVAVAVQEFDGTQLMVHARSPHRLHAFARRFSSVEPVTDIATAAANADLVINATPIGMRDSEHPVDIAMLSANCSVLDLVYRVDETPWVRAARARGLAAADGLSMLVEQGALAFEWWFEVPADRAAMWKALR